MSVILIQHSIWVKRASEKQFDNYCRPVIDTQPHRSCISNLFVSVAAPRTNAGGSERNANTPINQKSGYQSKTQRGREWSMLVFVACGQNMSEIPLWSTKNLDAIFRQQINRNKFVIHLIDDFRECFEWINWILERITLTPRGHFHWEQKLWFCAWTISVARHTSNPPIVKVRRAVVVIIIIIIKKGIEKWIIIKIREKKCVEFCDFCFNCVIYQ